MKQYYIKVVRGYSGRVVYFNYGLDKRGKYKNTETAISDNEYISITTYNYFEFEEYKNHIDFIQLDKRAKLSINI